MKNVLLKTFLEDEKINELYQSCLENPTSLKEETFERYFKIHVRKIQLLSYFSKILHFEAQKFDKKIRRNYDKNQLIFDKDDERNIYRLSESIEFACELVDPISFEFVELEELFGDKKIYSIVSDLSLRQKEVLYLIYVKDMSEDMVAEKLVITKQSVNKTKNKALNRIKKQYEQKTEVN